MLSLRLEVKKLVRLTDEFGDIIKGCIEGDRQCQEDLYRILAPRMYAICLRYASDADEAGDFLQEGFITVFSKIREFRQEGSFEGWVRKIMVNTALQFLRKKRQMYILNETITEDRDYEVPDIQYYLDKEDLLEMIRVLPVNQRMVFNLYAIEGYNHTEIADMTGIPENTSKSHLHRARLALKEMLEKSSRSESEKLKRNG